MINKEILKKQIIYRSKHRGTKEMDILLGKFTNKYINIFNIKELTELNALLNIEDEILYNWYFNKTNTKSISNNKVSKLLKSFKL